MARRHGGIWQAMSLAGELSPIRAIRDLFRACLRVQTVRRKSLARSLSQKSNPCCVRRRSRRPRRPARGLRPLDRPPRTRCRPHKRRRLFRGLLPHLRPACRRDDPAVILCGLHRIVLAQDENRRGDCGLLLSGADMAARQERATRRVAAEGHATSSFGRWRRVRGYRCRPHGPTV